MGGALKELQNLINALRRQYSKYGLGDASMYSF